MTKIIQESIFILPQDEYVPANLKPYGRMVMAKKQQSVNAPKAGNLQKSHHLRML